MHSDVPAHPSACVKRSKTGTLCKIDESASTDVGSGSDSSSDTESIVSGLSKTLSVAAQISKAAVAVEPISRCVQPTTCSCLRENFLSADCPTPLQTLEKALTTSHGAMVSDASGGLIAVTGEPPCIGSSGNSLPCSGGFGTKPTDQRTAREQTLASARRLFAPVKVQMANETFDAACHERFLAHVGGAGPVKKWPAFGDVPGGQEALTALRKCDPSLPVKRNMPQCLDDDAIWDAWTSCICDGRCHVRNRHAHIVESCRDRPSSVAKAVAR